VQGSSSNPTVRRFYASNSKSIGNVSVVENINARIVCPSMFHRTLGYVMDSILRRNTIGNICSSSDFIYSVVPEKWRSSEIHTRNLDSRRNSFVLLRRTLGSTCSGISLRLRLLCHIRCQSSLSLFVDTLFCVVFCAMDGTQTDPWSLLGRNEVSLREAITRTP